MLCRAIETSRELGQVGKPTLRRSMSQNRWTANGRSPWSAGTSSRFAFVDQGGAARASDYHRQVHGASGGMTAFKRKAAAPQSKAAMNRRSPRCDSYGRPFSKSTRSLVDADLGRIEQKPAVNPGHCSSSPERTRCQEPFRASAHFRAAWQSGVTRAFGPNCV